MARRRRETASPLTPEQRTLRARIAAFTRHAQCDGREATAAATAGQRAKYLREAQARWPELPPHEHERRAEAAYRAHMTALSYRASRAKALARRRRDGSPPDGAVGPGPIPIHSRQKGGPH